MVYSIGELTRTRQRIFNPSNTEATFTQNTRMQRFLKPLKPYHVGMHWIALAEYSHMSTRVPRFQLFYSFFAAFCIGQISHQQHNG